MTVTYFIRRYKFDFNPRQKKFYTLIMADPDAPPQIEGEFFMHLLKSNVPVRKITYLSFFLVATLAMYVCT